LRNKRDQKNFRPLHIEHIDKIDPGSYHEIGADGYGKEYQYPFTDDEEGFSGGNVLAENSDHNFFTMKDMKSMKGLLKIQRDKNQRK